MTIGARAASKVLVQAGRVVLFLIALGGFAHAQTPAPAPQPPAVERFAITDNSFLVEEAFNQERGVFQNIFNVFRYDGGWEATFTQEWPMPSQTHQFSYTIPFGGAGGQSGVGDVLLNYRYQLWTEDDRRPAFSPRLSLILPSGDEEKGFGNGSLGLQVNLPFSKQRNDIYFHWNGGFTLLPGVSDTRCCTVLPVEDVTLLTPHLSGSAIWRARPMLNLMMETVLEWPEELSSIPGITERFTSFTLSPGARGGWNIGDHQLIVGVALPITWAQGDSEAGVFGYFSYELPFKR